MGPGEAFHARVGEWVMQHYAVLDSIARCTAATSEQQRDCAFATLADDGCSCKRLDGVCESPEAYAYLTGVESVIDGQISR